VTTPRRGRVPGPATRVLSQVSRAPHRQPPPAGSRPSPAGDRSRPLPRQVDPATVAEVVRPPAGSARRQRGALLGGLFATVALGFATAPYAALLVVCLLSLGVRAVSWTTESAEQRQRLRGRRRWYDGPLTLVSAPWYLVVATAGTLVLLLWSATVAFVAGFGYLLFGGPLKPGLVLMGAVLALSLWWGPASRRVRTPTRRLVRALTGNRWVGWLAVTLVACTAAVGAYALLTGTVSWEPSTGPPWRSGTVLGDVLRWL
jgi:hypothetical protein